MEETKCLECGSPVIQNPGRRKKEYCGTTCRSKYWKKQNQKGKPRRKPGRPRKETSNILNYPRTLQQQNDLQEAFRPLLKKAEQEGKIKEFMGHPIPSGLKGIDLSIWKAEIKETEKRK